MVAVLAQFPLKSQLAESDPNDRMDCVAVSFAAAIQWLTKRPVTGAELKDAEYGRNYIGGTALRRYVDEQGDLARAKYGCTASPIEGEPVDLVRGIHADMRAGIPVIATIPSTWGIPRTARQLDAPTFSTHAICFFEEVNGGLGAMNPWGGFIHTGSDSYWDARLCYRQRWRVTRFGAVSPSPLGGPPVWTKVNPGLWRDAKGHTCGGAMGQFMSDKGLLAADGLSSEVYKAVAGLCDAYLPLGNGTVLTASKVTQGWQVRGDRGAQLLLALLDDMPVLQPIAGSAIGDQIVSLIKQAVQS